jgi:hypothetical protein
MDERFKTSILFIIFNRPDVTARVFNEIKKIRPSKLYVVADGPRTNKDLEDRKCEDTRRIIDLIDWDCEVFKNYSDTNLGCKKRVSSGINWFFENVEEGIILEDDCLPNESFFKFCEEMLVKYRNEERIGMISGNNFQFGKVKKEYSYYFSRYSHIWGWATWRRAWNKYNVNIDSWPEIKKEGKLKKTFSNIQDVYYWSSIFDDVYNNKIDTWDYQWTFTCLINNYLSVMPSVNLITNIGFSQSDSTHTRRISKFSNMKSVNLDFPLAEPPTIERSVESDKITQRDNYPFWRFFIGKIIKRLINKYNK